MNHLNAAPILRLLIALNGFIAVGLGAFGAHAWRALLIERGMLETWRTASLYHLVHAVAALAGLVLFYNGAEGAMTKRATGAKAAAIAWLIGCLLFSGSLYGLALGGPRWLGPVTPLGGVALLVGWAWLAWDAFGGRAETPAR